MSPSTNQYKLYATFSSIITYALILVHLLSRCNALTTIAPPPSPSPPLPPSQAQRRLLPTQQQNVQQFYSNANSRRHGRWPFQWFFAPQHCKHPHRSQTHLISTNFDQHSIGLSESTEGFTIPIPTNLSTNAKRSGLRPLHTSICRNAVSSCSTTEPTEHRNVPSLFAYNTPPNGTMSPLPPQSGHNRQKPQLQQAPQCAFIIRHRNVPCSPQYNRVKQRNHSSLFEVSTRSILLPPLLQPLQIPCPHLPNPLAHLPQLSSWILREESQQSHQNHLFRPKDV